jgi:hypothetical protein
VPDWKKIVREKLGRLPLNNGRQDEVIDELAQQLESAYDEAITDGASEPEALRRSLAQFSDWEKLRSDVFRSVEGTQLPLWEQNGIFAPRRRTVWIALALTLLLLAVPAFRQALAVFPVPGSNPTAWSSRAFSDRALRKIEQSGDTQKYARTLAFVALHSPDDLQAVRAGEKAISLDPQLTWISARISHATYLIPGYDPHPWIERLKAWDSQNAFPYLLEASANVHGDWEKRWAKYNAATPALREALAAEPAWRIPMDKAFAAPRVDFYWAQQFALDRQVLQEQGLDRPDMLMVAVWSQQIPELQAIKFYQDIQLKDVAESAEKVGHSQEALSACWTVARFGDRLHSDSWDSSDSSDSIVEVFSVMLREQAYKRMIPLLRSEGRTEEAATVETALSALPALDRNYRQRRGEAFESSAKRSARIVQLAGFAFFIFGAAALVWLLSSFLLWWRPSLSRALNRVASAFGFVPPALLFAGLLLLVAYYPYAQPIGQIASQEETIRTYAPFFMNLLIFLHFNVSTDVWIARMFWPAIWCAIVALAGALLLWWMARRQRPDDTGVA